LIAAALLGRRAVGIDASPEAARTFLDRLEEHPELKEGFSVLDFTSEPFSGLSALAF